MMRDKIARIVTLDHLQLLHDFDVDPDLYRMDPECADGAYAVADAIIAALSDMIPDLEWVTPSPTTDGQWQDASGVYDIEESILFIGHVETGIRYPNDKEAKAAANAHHRAAIMAAFGVAS